MDRETLLRLARGALNMAGVETPAFEALFEAVKAQLAPADQATLQNQYELAKARWAGAHRGLQDAGRGRR